MCKRVQPPICSLVWTQTNQTSPFYNPPSSVMYLRMSDQCFRPIGIASVTPGIPSTNMHHP